LFLFLFFVSVFVIRKKEKKGAGFSCSHFGGRLSLVATSWQTFAYSHDVDRLSFYQIRSHSLFFYLCP
jgi:hypothetical protein